MKYHQPSGQFTITSETVAVVADSLRFALQQIRAAGGRPLEPYDALNLTDCDHAQAAIMDIAEALDIDLGHKRYNKLDLRKAAD